MLSNPKQKPATPVQAEPMPVPTCNLMTSPPVTSKLMRYMQSSGPAMARVAAEMAACTAAKAAASAAARAAEAQAVVSKKVEKEKKKADRHRLQEERKHKKTAQVAAQNAKDVRKATKATAAAKTTAASKKTSHVAAQNAKDARKTAKAAAAAKTAAASKTAATGKIVAVAKAAKPSRGTKRSECDHSLFGMMRSCDSSCFAPTFMLAGLYCSCCNTDIYEAMRISGRDAEAAYCKNCRDSDPETRPCAEALCPACLQEKGAQDLACGSRRTRARNKY